MYNRMNKRVFVYNRMVAWSCRLFSCQNIKHIKRNLVATFLPLTILLSRLSFLEFNSRISFNLDIVIRLCRTDPVARSSIVKSGGGL